MASMRACGVALDVDGIGGERLESAGVRLTQRNAGWASMGPLDAIGKIPKLLAVASRMAVALRAQPRDLIVLVDFGAFNLRLARMIRMLGSRTPMLYYFPPAAWLRPRGLASVHRDPG